MLSRAVNLQAVKLLHTLIWAFFAGCIIAIPILSLLGKHGVAIGLVAVVLIEVLVLLFNGWSCPLTGVAARYTDDRQENFDIYLPRLLAKYNKHVFGALYVVGTVCALLSWAHATAA